MPARYDVRERRVSCVAEIGDKTLVVWAAPANLDQGGGRVDLEQRGIFDAIVLAVRAKWMAGSNILRTSREMPPRRPVRTNWLVPQPAGTMALYRDGRHVTMSTPAADSEGPVSDGLRHLTGARTERR